MAQRLDPDGLMLAGEPIPLAEGVRDFAASENGVLVYRKAAAQAGAPAATRELLWFDRNGKPAGRVGPPSTYGNPRLSPDGHRVAVDTVDSGKRDIWVIDINQGVPARRTFDPAPDSNPVWAPDGSRIVFNSSRGDNPSPSKLYQTSASGAGSDELLLATADGNNVPQDWSFDARYILYTRARLATITTVDLWALPLFGDKKAIPLLQSPSRKVQAQLSLDGRWMAYSTNESGTYQIVVQPFPDPTKGKWQVTTRGGVEPRWRRDGRELFYLGLDGKLMAVPIIADGVVQSGQPAPLFQTPLQLPANPAAFRYDVTADGQRFLINAPIGVAPTPTSPAPTTITTVVNWSAALRKK